MKTIQAMLAMVLGLAIATEAGAATKPAVTGTVNPVNGMLTTSGSFTYTYPQVNGAYIAVAAGTTAYSATLSVNGTSRSYIVMRPVAAPSTPPALLVLLHPLNTTPVQMANLTKVTNFVATQGFWVVLPQAINGQWDDDPSLTPPTDTNFISALITALVAQGVDATRVYAAGYSDGGFMSERLACELSTQIAAFGIDAGAVISSSPTYCKPAVQRPKLYILGTADNIVPYNGGMTGVDSALASMAFWVGLQHCGGTVASTLPTLVNDGTTVQLTNYTGCTAGNDLRLYTVDNGGHAWPNGLTQSVGKTTQNLDATGIIWSFASAYHK